jgi:hypothetical protein
MMSRGRNRVRVPGSFSALRFNAVCNNMRMRRVRITRLAEREGRMRFRYTVLKAAVVLVAVLSSAALGGAWAWAQQEEASQQADESQEITSTGVNLESTTQIRTPEQGGARSGAAVQQYRRAEPRQADQQSAECPGAQVVDTIGPTSEDLRIGPFRITGEKFRLTYETMNLDENGQPFLDVTVLDKEGNEVGGQVIFEEGTEKEIVPASPGSFTLEVRAEDLEYKITIEDCTGKQNQNPNQPPTGGSPGDNGIPGDGQQPISEDQYQADVIADTIPNKPLPNTGGVPLLGMVILGLAFVGVGFSIFRAAMRQNA